MADSKKGTIIAVSIVSLLLVGTAIFFVVKGAGLKPKPQVDDEGEEDEKNNKKKVDDKRTSTGTGTGTGTGIGNFFENIRDKVTGGLKTKDPSTFEGFKFPIRRTQRGENVKRLQQLLLTFDKNIIPQGATGYFGTQTETALEKVIGKKQVESQADILAIESKIKQKAGTLMSGALINQQLGIKLF
jgi:hypothetical protein